MKKALFILCIFLVSMSNLMADSFGIYAVTDKNEVAPGDTVKVSIMMTCLDEEWEGYDFKVGLEYDPEIFTIDNSNYRVRDGWEFEFSNGGNNKFMGTIKPVVDPWITFAEDEIDYLMNECYSSGVSIIDNIKLKVKDNVKNQTAKIYSVMADDKDGYANVKIYSKSSDNSLSSLSIAGYDLLFKKDVTSYDLSVPYKTESINLKYACSGTGCSVTNNGTMKKDLVVGKNTIEIEVKAENGAKKKYTITVNRQSPDNSSTLSTLELTNNSNEKIDINFNKDVFTYNIEVPYEVTYVKSFAKCESQGCNVKYEEVTSLEVGINTLTFEVTAESGDISKYIVNISREEEIETNIVDTKEETKEKEQVPKKNNTLVIVLSAVCIILVICVGVLVYLLKKNKKVDIIKEKE